MLTGYFKYGDYKYILEGYDFEDNVALYLSALTAKARLFVDSGIHVNVEIDENSDNLQTESYTELPKWDKLYVSIGGGNVKADCYIETNNGIKYKNSLNAEMLCRLGAIIRGMKLSCNKNNIVDAEGAYEAEFSLNKSNTYRFDNGYVILNMRTLQEISYKDEGVELFLEEDGSYELKVYKLGDTVHRFKLDLSEFIVEKEDDSWDFGTDDTIFSLSEIIEKNPDKSYLWLKGRKYTVVKEIEEVERICKRIWKHNGIVAFDTETTGLNVNITSRTGDGDRLVGMVFSIIPGEAWYFPIAHKYVKNICNEGNEHYIIEKYFKPLLEKKDILCHNGSFDWKVMYNYDICINLKHDTYILFKVTLWNDHRGMQLSLKKLTKQFLGRDSFELSDFVRGKFGKNNVAFWDLEEESVKYYACPDTDNLIELFQYATDNDLLGKYDAKKTYEMEVAFSIVIAYQEYYGHCVDVDKMDGLINDIETALSTEYKEMVKIAKHDFNPESSPQLINVIINELKYPVVDKTDTGNPSTGKEARSKWMSYKNPDGTDMYPFARHLQVYKDNATLKSNFTKNLDKFATEEGLCFSEVQQFLETGRVSVKEPNYQSYSDKVKKYIVPRTGYYALDADYSSVEARIMVSMAGCKSMVEKLKDPDMDYHTAKASDMFGVPYELVSKKLRKMSKGVNFGILYGLGDWNLAINLGRQGSRENALWAKKQKELYFKGMEELRGFIDKSKAQGTTQFYSTTYFGRRRYYDPRKTRTDKIERQSCNARIQGTAADIYKLAMIRLFNQLRKRGLLGKVLISAFVHDECFLEVHKSLDPCRVLKMLRECMMLEIEGWCPLFIGCGFGRNWYEAKKTEIPVQVQDIFINEWGESGLDWWNGDSTRLYEWEVDQINGYRRDRVINYIKDENNWNKVLSPVENSLAYEVMEEIKSGAHVQGVVDSDFKIVKDDMIKNLEQFCKAFGILDIFEKANIKKPEHTEIKQPEMSEEDLRDLDSSALSNEEIIKMRVKTVGVHSVRNFEGRKVYFRYDEKNPVLLNICHKIIASNPGDAEVLAVKEDGKIYTTNMYMNISAYPKLLQLFIQYANIA